MSRKHRFSWGTASLPLAVALLLLSAACTDSPPIAFIEIYSEGRLESVQIWVKRYADDGRVYQNRLGSQGISADRTGYVVGEEAGSPLRLRIDFPRSGRYAVHLVGLPTPGRPLPDGSIPDPDDRFVETRCYDIDGEVVDQEVYLSLLTARLDEDRDTFPDDLTTYCNARAEVGLPCDSDCQRPDFNALVDCNPSRASRPPVGCPSAFPTDEEYHPFAVDFCGDCFDQDCYDDDAHCEDRDDDGFPAGEDCDDDDPAVNPATIEICGNGFDENCTIDLAGCDDGDLPCDEDGDGAVERLSDSCGLDCNDGNDEVHPDAPEGCGADPVNPRACPGCGDEVDNDCDGLVDEGCFPEDIDHDGVPAVDDCNDCNAAIGPGATELCGNEVDEDCTGSDLPCDPADGDHDGYRSSEMGGADCDDSDASAYPGAPDRCGDGIAQDCAHDVECDEVTDNDSDLSSDQGDCDDNDPSINPWATEVCDEEGEDEDCDGAINEVPAAANSSSGCGFSAWTNTWYEIDYLADMDHCGSCRHRCCPSDALCEGDSCEDGRCHCASHEGCGGEIDDFCCPTGCADLTSDVENCGTCGARCALNEECRPSGAFGRGECHCPGHEGSCPSEEWTACCGVAGCIDLSADANSCGSCENDCHRGTYGPRGDICALDSSGAPTCYCGEIGVQCGGGDSCTEVTEPAGSRCGCANLERDVSNCGACGNVCDENEVCRDGRCACGSIDVNCSGADTSFCCPTGCENLLTDPRNCGRCGNRCALGETCLDGRCACSSDEACDDGIRCTEDHCTSAHTCVHQTLDADDDGWCDFTCPDSATGGRGDCTDGDCDDSNPAINPWAEEDCSTIEDDDCDGDRNDVDARGCTDFYLDGDSDGFYRDGAPGECRCEPTGVFDATTSADCDDRDGEVYPDADERCNGIDDDCDGTSDDDSEACADPEQPFCCSRPFRCCECLDDGDCGDEANPDCEAGTCQCRVAGVICRAAQYCCLTGCSDDPCTW